MVDIKKIFIYKNYCITGFERFTSNHYKIENIIQKVVFIKINRVSYDYQYKDTNLQVF